MASFEEILKKPASEFKAPAAFPVGTYHCLIDGPAETGKSSQKGTGYVRLKFKVLSPMQDVDAAQAAEQQVVGKTFTNDYYITDGATWRLTEGLLQDTLGLDISKPIDELLSEVPGKQLLVTLRHEPSPDGKRVFHRVASTAHV